jgi:Family of unknown function (DUF6459)
MPEPHCLINLGLTNLRLVKVPDAAPPYDCQIHGAQCPGSGFDVAPGEVASAGPGDAPGLAVAAAVTDPVTAVVADPVVVGDPVAVSDPVATVVADPATARPRQLALVIVEVLAGVRPDRQLVPLATDRVRARVRGLAPLLASDRRPRIQRMVTSRPAGRVVELTVVADFGPRSRALAMRFEHVAARPAAPGWPARPARWLCTVIEAG